MTSAYLIDPLARTITIVERGDKTSLSPVYALLHCRGVERYALGGGDLLYVDEQPPAGGGAFVCHLYPDTSFIGRALWIGSSAEGEEADPDVSLDIAAESIVFVSGDFLNESPVDDRSAA
ncbi:hypothetical protein [Caballeronia sp. RCC_10]|jgi:hypothetical protein|uniref:hypothetical protein n=1 Tax=Caballeronia sp. RCC_10 TaxID=3239227 RepID=UPI0035232C7E